MAVKGSIGWAEEVIIHIYEARLIPSCFSLKSSNVIDWVGQQKRKNMIEPIPRTSISLSLLEQAQNCGNCVQAQAQALTYIIIAGVATLVATSERSRQRDAFRRKYQQAR